VAQRGERRIVVRVPAKLPYLLMGYKVPVLKTSAEEWEPYALDVLAAILAGDDSARLPRELVRGQELAADASVFYDPQSRLDTLMVIEATPAKDRGVADLEQALRRQVARVQQEPVTPQELERVKTQVVTADVYERDSVFYQAMRIGKLEAIGLPWQVADQYVERVRAVTPEQVQAVARKYLLDERLTVAVLEPQPLAVGQARTVSGDHRHVR
jgi:zinc protease